MFEQACGTAWHVPRNTCCRHKPTPTLPLPLHDNKKGVQYAGMHYRAQEHTKLQGRQHFDTHTEPSCSLRRAIGGVPCAVRALCEKLAVLHHREFGKFRRLKGRH